MNDTDISLMQRIARQDQRALSTLYDRFGGAVYSLARRILGSETMAEEVTQDIFLKVWGQAQKWDPDKGQLSSWLLTITRYTAIDRLRKENRRPPQSAFDDLANLLPSAKRVGDARWHDGQVLQQLLDELPDEQSQVIELAFFQGMTHSQMAETLDLPLGTVKTRVRLGLQKLKGMWIAATSDDAGIEKQSTNI